MSCSVTFKPGISFWGSFSCQSFTLMGTHLISLQVQVVTLRFVLKGTNVLQSGAVASAFKRSCWQVLIFSIRSPSRRLLLSLLCFLNLFCFCSSVFACGVARSLILSRVWVSHEAGSLPLLYSACLTWLQRLHTQTYGRYSSAAYNFWCCCQHNCCPCTISAHTPTVLLAIFEHVKRLINNFVQVFVSPRVAAIVHRLLAGSLSFYQRMYICTLRKSQVSVALHIAQFSYPTSVALLPLSHWRARSKF